MGWPRKRTAAGDAGDPVRDRLGEQDLHRHLAGYALAQDKMRLDDRASHWPALQGSRFDSISLLDLATYTAGGFAAAVPRLGAEGPGTDHDYYRQWQPTYAPGSQRLYSNPSIGLFRLSRRAQPGPRSNDSWSSKCSRHWASNRPTSTCPRRRWRSTPGLRQGRPPATGPVPAALDAEGYGVKDQRGRPAALRRCQPASGALDKPWAQALDATHRGYYKVGDMTQGLGWGSLRLADLPEAPAGGQLDADGLQPQDRQAARATGAGGPAPAEQDRFHQRLRRLRGVRPGPRPGTGDLANRNYPNAERVKIAYAILSGTEQQGKVPLKR